MLSLLYLDSIRIRFCLFISGEKFVADATRVKTLLDARKKVKGRVVGLPADSQLRSQCIRLGLSIGAEFLCIERLPGGTIVVEAYRQEIALGRDLAATIQIELV